ncbi:hypothetical protein AB8Z38_03045 [Bradyrhizobium sp. LLZ17]|uniref:HIG1 domain-containing protein n=1 Tax=Bradyrhizobium sp. LLZ17 TaxID=3239388 RepID=A0AB39XKM9_9BRAD
MKDVSFWIATLAAFSSAVLGVSAGVLRMRDNEDKLIDDLRRQSHLAAWAAAFAGISVLAQAIERMLK